MAPNDFDGQVALVTGGGSGIGRAICRELARDGARVVVTDIILQAARETITLMENSGNHLAVQMDVTQQSAIESAIAASRDKFGEPPSLLVNSAGISEVSPFLDVTEDKLDRMIDVNIKGTFLTTQAVIRALLEGDPKAGEGRGAVVNISSIMGKTGFPHYSHYAATKGGIIAFTKSCAAEMAKNGIRVNCVLPGHISTPLTKKIAEVLKRYSDKMTSELRKWDNDRTPLGRPGRPEEIAEVVVFLLSRRSSYMVGACVEISGGVDM